MELEFHPLTAFCFPDFEKLFGERGACGGCWCMYWRLRNRDYEHQKGEANYLQMRTLVEDGVVPGILAYADGVPVGWCSLGPRKDFIRLQTSRLFKPLDDQEVWSIVCFFIHPVWRGKGVQTELIRYVLKYCRTKGVKILEAYPHVPAKAKMPNVFAWTGIAKAFLNVGFQEVASPSATRRIVRYYFQ